MKNKKWIMLALCLVLAFTAGGCGGGADEDTISGYKDEQIVLSGLAEEDITITAADLAALESVRQKAEAPRSNGQIVSVDAVGPLMSTLLDEYGKKQTDFARIRFTASDGYSIAYASDVLESRDIILMLADGKEGLPEADQPLRVIVPGERAMYWVRKVCRIDFETDESAASCSRIVMLESAARLLQQEEYEYNGAKDRAVSARGLIETYADANEGTNLTLVAADGLRKSETAANFFKGLIKYTGEDSPRLVGNLPEGMQVFDLVWVGCGDTMFVSLPQLVSVSGVNGSVTFSELLKQAGFSGAESCTVSGADGTSRTYPREELSDAYLYTDGDGKANLSWGGGSSTFADILCIEAK